MAWGIHKKEKVEPLSLLSSKKHFPFRTTWHVHVIGRWSKWKAQKWQSEGMGQRNKTEYVYNHMFIVWSPYRITPFQDKINKFGIALNSARYTHTRRVIMEPSLLFKMSWEFHKAWGWGWQIHDWKGIEAVGVENKSSLLIWNTLLLQDESLFEVFFWSPCGNSIS